MSTLSVEITRRIGAFSLDVRFGCGREILALFGSSGAGKSMTLECVAGLARPDRGEIILGGRHLVRAIPGLRRIDLPARDRRVGYVPQDGALFPHRTIAENVAYASRFAKGAPRSSTAAIMGEMGIAHLAARYPREISGGQARRAAIARALAGAPELLLLDEPFVHLDRVVQARLVADLVRLTAERAIPVVLVTHDVDVLARAADRVVVLEAGRVAQEGTRDEVLLRPATSGIARLLGDVNLLPGVVRAPADGLWLVEAGGVCWRVPHIGPVAAGTRVELMIRRNAVKIVRPDAPLPAELAANLLVARLAVVELRPDVVHATFELAGGMALAATIPRDRFQRHGFEPGADCRIALDPAGITLFVLEG